MSRTCVSLFLLAVQPEPPSEAALKSVFLLNFAKYVGWPPRAFADEGSPIRVGVLGRDPLGPALDVALKNKRAQGRPLRARRCGRPRDVSDVHLLFVGRQEERRLPELLERLKGEPVLLVGETRAFCRAGGTLSVIVEDGRVVVEANPDAAARADLVLSARLLRIARLVRSEP